MDINAKSRSGQFLFFRAQSVCVRGFDLYLGSDVTFRDFS